MRARPGETVRVDVGEIDPPVAAAAAPLEIVRDSLAKKVARGQVSLRDAVEELKRDAVASTLEETGGNWAEAARRLGMDRSNLHHLAQRLRMPGR